MMDVHTSAHSNLIAAVTDLKSMILALHEDMARTTSDERQVAARSRSRSDPAWRTANEGTRQFFATYFGSFSLRRASETLAIDQSWSCLELCRYLIARAGRPVRREELLDLLWPEVEADRATHRLHVAISSLRRIVDEPGTASSAIQLEGDGYRFVDAAVDSDCAQFEVAYGRALSSLARGDEWDAATGFGVAVELYRDDYLADHAYAEWTFLPREHFRERRLTALTFLCDDALRGGNLLGALDLANLVLETDGLRERAHRQLMRILYRLGERGRAIRQFELCAAILNRELGVLPSIPTQALCAAIRADAALPDESPFFS